MDDSARPLPNLTCPACGGEWFHARDLQVPSGQASFVLNENRSVVGYSAEFFCISCGEQVTRFPEVDEPDPAEVRRAGLHVVDPA